MTTTHLEPFQIAVPTAFNADESLNTTATLDHVRYLAKHGTRSVLISGSTGEQHSMTLTEKQALVTAIDATDLPANLEIIFGVASIRQREAVALARSVAQSRRITGALVGFPPYILPTQQEAAGYFTAIANALTKPTIIYNNPHRTGFSLDSPTFTQLSRLPHVVGIKEAGDPERVPALRRIVGNDFAIYTGGEVDLAHRIALGYDHLSSISANLYPTDMHDWFAALMAGAPYDDTLIQRHLAAVHSGSTLTFVKKRITAQEGIPMGQPRTPLGNFTE